LLTVESGDRRPPFRTALLADAGLELDQLALHHVLVASPVACLLSAECGRERVLEAADAVHHVALLEAQLLEGVVELVAQVPLVVLRSLQSQLQSGGARSLD